MIRRDADFDLPEDFFVQLLRNGQAVVLLLDGLDEISNEDEREVVRQAIEELVSGRADMRVTVSCRIAAYKGRTALGGEFREVLVKGLERKHIHAMVQKFYGCIHPGEPKEAKAKTKQLMDGIEQLERQRGHSQAGQSRWSGVH